MLAEGQRRPTDKRFNGIPRHMRCGDIDANSHINCNQRCYPRIFDMIFLWGNMLIGPVAAQAATEAARPQEASTLSVTIRQDVTDLAAHETH